MTDEEVDKIWLALYKQERYLFPFATGDYMLYHYSLRLANTINYYEVTCPRRFVVQLFYEDNLVKLAPDKIFKPRVFVEFPMTIKLEEWFETKNWRGRDIPIALKRFELQYKVERLMNLMVFT